MSERERFLTVVIFLLQEEVACLRSVLSEWDHDKDCYLQMNRADDLARVILNMEHKL